VTTANSAPLSSAVEDYLKAVYALESAGERATTSALAGRMRVSAPSVTVMMKRLAALGLVERAPYRGVMLTETGRLAALEVLRHHRLLERYLADVLGLGLDQVHAEADALEHVLSEELEQRIDAALGFPTRDPHGDPIPDASLKITAQAARTVAELEPGESAVVTRVPDGDPELLRYLGELALVPGDAVELIALGPFGGPATVRTQSGEHAIARELAATIDVA
jgi:DtxR family transcriptional regulator, Mn-dependent transcriptional regulator